MRPARLGESKNRDERLQGGWREKERKKEREKGWDKRGEREVRSTGTLAFVFAGSGCPTVKKERNQRRKRRKTLSSNWQVSTDSEMNCSLLPFEFLRNLQLSALSG